MCVRALSSPSGADETERSPPNPPERAGSATAYGASGNATLGWVVTGSVVLEISGPVLTISGPYEGVKGPPALPASETAGALGRDAQGVVVASVFGPVLFSRLWGGRCRRRSVGLTRRIRRARMPQSKGATGDEGGHERRYPPRARRGVVPFLVGTGTGPMPSFCSSPGVDGWSPPLGCRAVSS